MAIGINNVYQKVLALANKEQRGYITPQEFNLFADQAQMEIFEQYFYDLEQRQRAVGNEFDYADMVNSIEEKISIFEINNKLLSIIDNIGNVDVNITDANGHPNMYKLGSVTINYPNVSNTGYEDIHYTVEQIQIKDLNLHRMSSLQTFSRKRPVYVKYSESLVPVKLQIYPHPSQSSIVAVNYIRRPKRPNWTYILSGNKAKNALYNSSAPDHQNFELHISEESNLVTKILQLAGVAIKDFGLAQVAGQKEVNTIQQQKQ